MVKLVKPLPLSSGGFAPFGQVICASDWESEPDRMRQPDVRYVSGTRGWRFDFESGQPLVMMLETPYADKDVDLLESHAHVTQTFLPMGGVPAVLFVAPPTQSDATPCADDVRAFMLDGTCGYILHTRTWHSLDRYPYYPGSTRWLMISDEETQADLPGAGGGQGKLTRNLDLEREWGFSLRVDKT